MLTLTGGGGAIYSFTMDSGVIAALRSSADADADHAVPSKNLLVEFVKSNMTDQMGARAARRAAELTYLGFMARNSAWEAETMINEWLVTTPFADDLHPPTRALLTQFMKELTVVIYTEMPIADRTVAWEQLMSVATTVEEEEDTAGAALIAGAGVPCWCRPSTTILVLLARMLPHGDGGVPRALKRGAGGEVSVAEMVSLCATAGSYLDGYPILGDLTLLQLAVAHHPEAAECWSRAGFTRNRKASNIIAAVRTSSVDYSEYARALFIHAENRTHGQRKSNGSSGY